MKLIAILLAWCVAVAINLAFLAAAIWFAVYILRCLGVLHG
jgi:hypothetical protein